MEKRRSTRLLTVAVVLLIFSLDQSEALETSGMVKRSVGINKEVTSSAGDIVDKTLDFSYLREFTQNVQLTFGGNHINLTRFLIPRANEVQLDNFLKGENLADRLYVASKLAGINRMIAAANNLKLATFALEDMNNEEADIVFTPSDVDKMELRIKQEPDILNLNSPATLLNHAEFQNAITISNSIAKKRTKRAVTSEPSAKWMEGIPYVLTSDFDQYPSAKLAIQAGMRHWEEKTCLRFLKVDSFPGPHIIFKRLQGCYSKLGRQPNGQVISIGAGCDSKGVVVHLIGHALGFGHEHQRPDRSQYINIHDDTIKPNHLSNFLRTSWKDVWTENIPYDYSSVMHYGQYDFSTDRTKRTVSAIYENGGMNSTLGSRFGLTFYDAKLANYFYCKDKCGGNLTWSECQHDGYRNPNDCNTCVCPDGWTGTHCTLVQRGVNAKCSAMYRTATSKWKLLASPNYIKSDLPPNSQCTWHIQAEGEYSRVVMQFVGAFSVQKSCKRNICSGNYVEVRYKDLTQTGSRYCCKKPAIYLKSYGNETLLLLRTATDDAGLRGFKIRYKSEPCGGCDSTDNISGLACVKKQSYPCYGSFNVSCGSTKTGVCTRYRLTTCYKTVRYCCPGFQLVGFRCYAKRMMECVNPAPTLPSVTHSVLSRPVNHTTPSTCPVIYRCPTEDKGDGVTSKNITSNDYPEKNAAPKYRGVDGIETTVKHSVIQIPSSGATATARNNPASSASKTDIQTVPSQMSTRQPQIHPSGISPSAAGTISLDTTSKISSWNSPRSETGTMFTRQPQIHPSGTSPTAAETISLDTTSKISSWNSPRSETRTMSTRQPQIHPSGTSPTAAGTISLDTTSKISPRNSPRSETRTMSTRQPQIHPSGTSPTAAGTISLDTTSKISSRNSPRNETRTMSTRQPQKHSSGILASVHRNISLDNTSKLQSRNSTRSKTERTPTRQKSGTSASVHTDISLDNSSKMPSRNSTRSETGRTSTRQTQERPRYTSVHGTVPMNDTSKTSSRNSARSETETTSYKQTQPNPRSTAAAFLDMINALISKRIKPTSTRLTTNATTTTVSPTEATKTKVTSTTTTEPTTTKTSTSRTDATTMKTTSTTTTEAQTPKSKARATLTTTTNSPTTKTPPLPKHPAVKPSMRVKPAMRAIAAPQVISVPRPVLPRTPARPALPRSPARPYGGFPSLSYYWWISGLPSPQPQSLSRSQPETNDFNQQLGQIGLVRRLQDDDESSMFEW